MFRRLLVLTIVLAGLAAGGACFMHSRLVAPYRGFEGNEVFVDLPAGTGVSEMARRLSDAGVVADPWTFRIAARLSGADRHLQAGEYRFAEPVSAFEVVAKLAAGEVFTHPLTFPEGLTIREMAGLFEKSGLGTAAAFEKAAADITLAAGFDPGAKSLEGYLFPSTYALGRQAGAPGAVREMVEAFDHAFDPELRAEAAARGMTVREAVTLASLIEKETAQAAERPLVSAVYHNRLEQRIPLQCDPTVVYALMRAGKWTGNIRKQDLQIKSPYNTYVNPGLPPTPIASPGRASIEAAIRPADVPYLYFVSRNDGTHVFAATLEEHNRNVAKWQIQFFKK
ncbi:MAG: endolytic transglycosylase MltG [Acidobacteriota bacterium]